MRPPAVSLVYIPCSRFGPETSVLGTHWPLLLAIGHMGVHCISLRPRLAATGCSQLCGLPCAHPLLGGAAWAAVLLGSWIASVASECQGSADIFRTLRGAAVGFHGTMRLSLLRGCWHGFGSRVSLHVMQVDIH